MGDFSPFSPTPGWKRWLGLALFVAVVVGLAWPLIAKIKSVGPKV